MASVLERTWAKIDVRGPDECWPWLASVDGSGYGIVQTGRGMVHATRVVLAEKLGRPLVGNALHTCHWRPCCNPAHLYEGSQKQNAADMISAGRWGGQTGERHHKATLTDRQVSILRDLYARGVPPPALGRLFGIQRQNARRIAKMENRK